MVLRKLFGGSKEEKQEHAPQQTTEPVASAATETSSPQPANPGEPPIAAQLEHAMVENARSDTTESRNRVYQELLFSDLLLALADAPPGEEQKKENDPNNLSVAILSNPQNVRFAAAFTSGAAARRWRPEGGQFVSVRGQDIFKLLEPSPAEVIVVNPGSAPFVVLSKVEYRQLALGVVPQTQHSPVQSAVAGQTPSDGEASAAQQPPPEGQMQVAFPPDVFDDKQKAHALEIMRGNPKIEAAVLGAILPPNQKNDNWVRTVFLRVIDVEQSNEAMQSFCQQVRDAISANKDIFTNFGFEVGVMPDPGFWVHMHKNNIILFDKNPPALT